MLIVTHGTRPIYNVHVSKGVTNILKQNTVHVYIYMYTYIVHVHAHVNASGYNLVTLKEVVCKPLNSPWIQPCMVGMTCHMYNKTNDYQKRERKVMMGSV